MAVGMMGISRLICQPEADQRYNRAGSIGKIVPRICRNGYRAGNGGNGQLAAKQQQIADNADPSGQGTNPGTGMGIIRSGILR